MHSTKLNRVRLVGVDTDCSPYGLMQIGNGQETGILLHIVEILFVHVQENNGWRFVYDLMLITGRKFGLCT